MYFNATDRKTKIETDYLLKWPRKIHKTHKMGLKFHEAQILNGCNSTILELDPILTILGSKVVYSSRAI